MTATYSDCIFIIIALIAINAIIAIVLLPPGLHMTFTTYSDCIVIIIAIIAIIAARRMFLQLWQMQMQI